MQHDITKLCADSLRSYLNDNHGIKLKSGHAHEIVAAFFGYNSKIALLADKRYPLGDIGKAEFILLTPPTPFVDRRIKSLEGLPPELPPSYILVEGVYRVITGDRALLEKIQPSFRDLAIALAEDHGHRQLRMFGINPKDMEWITSVEINATQAEVAMTVIFDYPMDTGAPQRQSKVEIRLPRIAANIGYGTPEIAPTFYTGQMRDPDFRLKHGIA